MTRLLNSPWLYFALAGLLLVAAVASQFELNLPQRPVGSVEELDALAEREDLNVVFILVDTLRAGRLGSYGYERNTSPVMDAMARYGVRFDKVEGQSSWTKASMASLWTALYPQRTGVLRFPHAVPEEAHLPAEVLQEAGFRTAGVWRNGWVAPNFGFSQGFDLYLRPKPGKMPDRLERGNPSAHPLQGTDLDATDSAIEFLRTAKNERFFLYLHYMDVHQYVYNDESTLFGTGFSDIYDNAIHWTDQNVSLLMKELEDLELLDDTIVVIASDHGEEFREHGREGHAKTLYREVQEVPLILSLPFRLEPGVVVEEHVANVDIWPTLFDLLGLPPPPGADGRSLVPLVREAAAGDGAAEGATPDGKEPRPLFAQLDQSWGKEGQGPHPLVSLVRPPYRLLVYPGRDREAELYDHREDPWEQENLLAERPELAAELREAVQRHLDEGVPPWETTPEVPIDKMKLEQLRALGYAVGGGRGERPDAEGAEDEARPE